MAFCFSTTATVFGVLPAAARDFASAVRLQFFFTTIAMVTIKRSVTPPATPMMTMCVTVSPLALVSSPAEMPTPSTVTAGSGGGGMSGVGGGVGGGVSGGSKGGEGIRMI